MDVHNDEFVNEAMRAADEELINAARSGRLAGMESAVMNGAQIKRASDKVFVFTSFYCLVWMECSSLRRE